MFVSTDARRACSRGVIGSTMGTYPRGTGSNPVEGNGHFFHACSQLYLSSFSDTHTHTHTLYLSSFSDMPRPTQRRSFGKKWGKRTMFCGTRLEERNLPTVHQIGQGCKENFDESVYLQFIESHPRVTRRIAMTDNESPNL